MWKLTWNCGACFAPDKNVSYGGTCQLKLNLAVQRILYHAEHIPRLQAGRFKSTLRSSSSSFRKFKLMLSLGSLHRRMHRISDSGWKHTILNLHALHTLHVGRHKELHHRHPLHV